MAEEGSELERLDDDALPTARGSEDENTLEAASTDDADEDAPAEAEQIRDQIEATRSELGETIDAIQERLSFNNISEQVSEHVNNAVETAKVAVYHATIGKAAEIMKNINRELSRTSIVKTAKENPFPLILIGLGAGLLAYQSYSGSNKNSRSNTRRSLASNSTDLSARSNVDTAADTANSTLDLAREKVSGITGTVSNAAGSAYQQVSGAVGNAYTGAGELVSQAYGKVGDLGSTAKDQYEYYLEENPLAVGAVALALGAAVGFAIPATQYEGELMGDARKQLLNKAQSTATGLLDKTKDMLSEAGTTISDQARSMTEH